MFVPFVFNMSTINEAPYLWWFYKGLDFVKRTRSAIIAQEVYCNTPPSRFAGGGRREAFDKTLTDKSFWYRLPKNQDLETEHIYSIPERMIDEIIQEKGSLSDAFCYLLTRADSRFVQFLDALIPQMEAECGEQVEGFITLMEIPSLTAAAKARVIPVIHFELGCWREPTYLHTAFWDLKELYGENSVRPRWERFQQENVQRAIPLFSKRECLAVLLQKENLPLLDAYGREPQKKIGVALGYTTYELFSSKTHLNDSELLYRTKKRYGLENMLIRKHPGDPYGARYPLYTAAMEQKRNSAAEFILECETVISLLSGVEMEAMLWNRRAITLLPCPSYFASGHKIEGEGKCAGEDFISFFAFCYLIPLEFLMNVDYIRWRLTAPTEREIYFKHLEFYFKKKKLPTELIFDTPGRRLNPLLSAQGFRLRGAAAP